MTNEIDNHELTYAIKKPTPNRSGFITPKFIVMHYTAGNTAESAIRTFESKSSRVSAHVTIDLDGTIYQHAPFNVKTWHAGPSRHMGYNGLNSHAIGIEIVNVGWLRDVNGGWARDGFRVAKGAAGVVKKNARAGSGDLFWPAYPKIQLDAVTDLTKDLIEEYNILDIVSHEEIDTRGWKTDPGPAFPMEDYKRLLFNAPHRDLDEDRFEVTASNLNMRSGPGTAFGVTGALGRGEVVSVIDEHGSWRRIDSDNWVHGAYLRRVS